MAVQLSVTARNNLLNSLETTIGASAKLQIRSGAQPASCAAADSGTLLAEIALPSDWLADAATGSKAKAGTWSVSASGTGTAGHWRIKDNAGTTTHMQGSVTAVGGGGDMTLDNTSINQNQTVTINTFTISAANS